MEPPLKALKAGLPVRDFLLYVVANRSLLDVVHETSDFALHVSSVMETTWSEDFKPFRDTSIGRMSATSKKEVENGFPLLYANALVGLWGALEACVDDLCLLWIQCLDRQALADVLSGTRVKIGEYFALEDENRWAWILMQVRRSDGSVLRAGIGQFETLLKPLGISPISDVNIRTTLFRVKSMRNLYAHSAGKADHKFLMEWPDHPAQVGQIVEPTQRQFIAGYTAMVLFVESIHDCILRKLGDDLPDREFPPWISTTDDLLEMLVPRTDVPDGAPWSHLFIDDSNNNNSD